MNHRDFISKLGCMSNVNVLNLCFHTYRDFLFATSFSASTTTTSSSSPVLSLSLVSKLMLLSSTLFYVYVNFKTTSIKDNDDDNDNNKKIGKSLPKADNDNSNGNKSYDLSESNEQLLHYSPYKQVTSIVKRQSIIGKSLIAIKKDSSKESTTVKSDNDNFFHELSSGISVNSPVTTYDLEREIKYEDIFEDKGLNSSVSPLRKLKDDDNSTVS